MARYDALKRVRHIAAEDLPDELVHVVFSKLDFNSKVMAGLVCKRWDKLLKLTIAGARHWAVEYNLDTKVSSQALTSAEQGPIVEQFYATIGRWLIKRAAAIKVVHLSATLSVLDFDGEIQPIIAAVESQLPLLASCLSKHVNQLELTFYDGYPFASPVLSSPANLTFLVPMLKKLSLHSEYVEITASQFEAICELTSLEGLYIAMPDCIPESISRPQKLKILQLDRGAITDVPSGLERLANLCDLVIRGCNQTLRFPLSLQGMNSLKSVDLDFCKLETIPEAFSALSNLTRLSLCGVVRQSDGWWLTTLSSLTKLVQLDIGRSWCIASLPPHISWLQQLTKLDVGVANLRGFPDQLSSLQNLRELQAWGNKIPAVPVSILSSLTALTRISLQNQRLDGRGTFKVTSSLLPMLHQELVELDLRQDVQWDQLSLFHLGCAMAEVAERTPVPTLRFLPYRPM